MIIKKSVRQIFLLLVIATLFGCATMSKDECLRADWYLKGLDDASQGYSADRIADHGRACARVQVLPNTKDYDIGHKKGARLYCVTNKGYSEGCRGASYNGICPRELEDNFLRAYRDGQALFAIQQKINLLASEVSNNDAFIEENYEQIHRLKHELGDRDSSAQERRHKLRRIDDLQYEIVELELRINRALREMELFRYDFRTLEDRHYRQGYTP